LYLAEIMAEARLHQGARGGIKRFAGRIQDVTHYRRNW